MCNFLLVLELVRRPLTILFSKRLAYHLNVLTNRKSVELSYTDNYQRDTYGVIDFWVRNNFEHGEFFDREISHHEMELARANQAND